MALFFQIVTMPPRHQDTKANKMYEKSKIYAVGISILKSKISWFPPSPFAIQPPLYTKYYRLTTISHFVRYYTKLIPKNQSFFKKISITLRSLFVLRTASRVLCAMDNVLELKDRQLCCPAIRCPKGNADFFQ